MSYFLFSISTSTCHERDTKTQLSFYRRSGHDRSHLEMLYPSTSFSLLKRWDGDGVVPVLRSFQYEILILMLPLPDPCNVDSESVYCNQNSKRLNHMAQISLGQTWCQTSLIIKVRKTPVISSGELSPDLCWRHILTRQTWF